MLRYGKAFDRYRMIKRAQHRNWYTDAIVLWGPPGTGKTTRAYEFARAKYGKSIFPLNINAGSDKVWWDGYTGQKCVIIEEFHGSGMPISYFNKMHDKFPFNVETKGSTVPFLAEMIIYTSNEEPTMWYGKGHAPGEPSRIPLDVLRAFKRRLTGEHGAVIEMKEEYVAPIGAIVKDCLQQFLIDEKDLKDNINRPDAPASGPIDLTTDSDEDVNDKENGDEYVDEEHELYDKYCEDDDDWIATRQDNDDDVDDVEDIDEDFETPPPPSQKRMFPPPLNRSGRMSVLIPKPQQNDGRFKKPRTAGTKVQTQIQLEDN